MVLYGHAASRSVPTAARAISLFLAIAQGAGLAGAAGIRPFLPPILAGALARADAGVDFDGTGYAFLESTAFLAAVLALAVLAYAIERARGRPDGEPRAGGDPLTISLAAVALALGAVLFAGALAAAGEPAWPGLPAGAALAALGFAATTGLLARVRRRLDRSAATLLPVWADAAALALAALAIFLPPAALAGLAGLVYLLVSGRRGARKYEGLRVLR